MLLVRLASRSRFQQADPELLLVGTLYYKASIMALGRAVLFVQQGVDSGRVLQAL